MVRAHNERDRCLVVVTLIPTIRQVFLSKLPIIPKANTCSAGRTRQMDSLARSARPFGFVVLNFASV
jgi:hypothetical protein